MGYLLEYIFSFRSEMSKLGYADGEINVFVSDATEDKQIAKMSQQECDESLEYLENYLSFAKKCKKLVMSS